MMGAVEQVGRGRIGALEDVDGGGGGAGQGLAGIQFGAVLEREDKFLLGVGVFKSVRHG